MMTKYLSFSLLITFFSISLFSQVTYVDTNATGSNDGTSWENAFTELESALDKFNNTSVFTEEEIWVAAGTYYPGGDMPDTSSTFYLNAPVDLFGGFSGTESVRTQRDVSTNEVILSGDFLKNDNGVIDSLDRLDNARHVLFIDNNLGRQITIDGFTVEGGHTSDNGDAEFIQRAGGGILTFAPINVSNCSFSNNYGRSGASIAYDFGGISDNEPFTILDCTFSNNLSDSQSAGIVLFEAADASIINCVFEDNLTNRGCCYPNNCDKVVVEDCVFKNNNNPDGFGGAMFIWQTHNLQLINNQYINNEANSAGAVYIDNRIIVNENMSHLITGCKFSDNNARSGTGGGLYINEGINMILEGNEFSLNLAETAGGLYYSGDDGPLFNKENLIIRGSEFRSNQAQDGAGGAFRTFKGSFTLDDCTFLGNVAAGSVSGGAIFTNGTNKEVAIENCFFGNNNANWGGAVAIYADTTSAEINNCSFLTNSVGSRGGGVYAGFKAHVTIDSSSFQTNEAGAGGAISMQNDSTTLIIKNSEILRNNSSGTGGAFFSGGGGANVLIENCNVDGNSGSFGGALAFSSTDNPYPDTAYFLVKNSIIKNNTAEEQGGAINIINQNGKIENCLIHNNTADGEGRGGAISHNALDSAGVEITLEVVNTTIANNLGLLSSGITSFEDLEGQSIVRLTNTLLYNIKDFEIEAGDPELISMGGNFSRDNGMANYFGMDDILGLDPLFVDQNAGDFRLMASSPCINTGVLSNATTTDLNGTLRDMMPDIGAYEFVQTTSTFSNNENVNEIKVWPNPVSEILTIQSESISTNAKITIFDNTGKRVFSQNFSQPKINIKNLEPGIYHLFVESRTSFRTSFIKL